MAEQPNDKRDEYTPAIIAAIKRVSDRVMDASLLEAHLYELVAIAIRESRAQSSIGRTPMEALRDMNAAVNQMLATKPDLPWVAREWEELPEAEKEAMAQVLQQVFFVPSATARTSGHSLQGEQDTKLLRAFTPAKTMAPGFEIEHWNLTMVRMKGDVVLTVRLPSEFSHYVQTSEGRMAAWHPGAVSSVRFTRELWKSLVEQIADADKVFKAADELDAIP